MKLINKKKGMTLIEVLVSIAILSIVIVPIGSLVVTSVKINKSGEQKQQGTYIAQRAIEQAKLLKRSTIDDLFSDMASTLNMVPDTEENYQGKIYYSSDGNITTPDNYKYMVKVKLTEYDHAIVNEENNEITDIIDIENYNDIRYSLAGGTGLLSDNEFILKYGNTVSEDNVLLLNNPEVVININNDFTDGQFIRIVLENYSDEIVNVYINNINDSNEQYKAPYTIVNKYGGINEYLNYKPNGKYKEIYNSVKLEVTTYDSDANRIAFMQGYKNLEE